MGEGCMVEDEHVRERGADEVYHTAKEPEDEVSEMSRDTDCALHTR